MWCRVGRNCDSIRTPIFEMLVPWKPLSIFSYIIDLLLLSTNGSSSLKPNFSEKLYWFKDMKMSLNHTQLDCLIQIKITPCVPSKEWTVTGLYSYYRALYLSLFAIILFLLFFTTLSSLCPPTPFLCNIQ